MASETTNTTSSKRRKTEQGIGTCLSGLPIGILEHTASFLAPISRALFAVTFTNYENNLPSGNYSSITGAADWDTLDFGEIEKELAERLSDDDISDVLQHIDAANTVKRLRLTNCIKITGAGLRPLHGSTVIEQVDLSLVGDGESPALDPEPPISCEAVLPILDSIISADTPCTMKHLQFPYKWRRDRYTDSEFHTFILRYHQMRMARDMVTCLYCGQNLPGYGEHWISASGDYYGTHAMSCYQCTNHFCYDCIDEDGIKNLVYCNQCQRDYCKNCVKVDSCYFCDRCGEFTCEYCSNSKECDECNEKMCSECVHSDGFECIFCGVLYCKDCNQNGDGRTISLCEECSKFGCDDCRLRRCQDGSSDCDGCVESLPQDTLVAQLKIQQERVRYLEDEVRKLELENKELKDKQRTEEKTSTE